jgi:hypothetical protein
MSKSKEKRVPKDLFGDELQAGEKIVYITHQHGHTILSWATIEKITWKENDWNTYMPYSIFCTKYAEKGGWSKNEDLPMTIILTNPTCLKVGRRIEDLIL